VRFVVLAGFFFLVLAASPARAGKWDAVCAQQGKACKTYCEKKPKPERARCATNCEKQRGLCPQLMSASERNKNNPEAMKRETTAIMKRWQAQHPNN